MKLTVKTEALQGITAKAIKGAGNLSMLAITSAIGIELINGNLVLTTTDNNTNLTVLLKDVSQNTTESFYACVNADLFCKLIAKQTQKTITFEVLDSCLQVVGDGVYNLPLIQDEEGQTARIAPIDVSAMTSVIVETAQLRKMLKYNKLAVSKLFDEPMYTGYCITDNKVFTYNGANACISEINLQGLKLLLPGKMVDLFEQIDDKNVTVSAVGNLIKFESDTICISGSVLEGLDMYPVKALNDTVYSDNFSYSAKVKKDILRGILDRLTLFTSNNDQHSLHLTFAPVSLMLSNMDSNACESIGYVLGQNEKINEADVFVDINDLKTIVDAIADNEITFMYGNPSALGICAGDMRYVMSVLSDDEEEYAETDTEENELTPNDEEEDLIEDSEDM